MISFARGAPSADLLPVDAVRAAAAAALDQDSTRALSYGTGIGHPGLCEWIGERHGGVDPARIMVTNGSLEAGWMLFGHLLAPGDEVVVEQPSYDRTLLMLEKLGVDRIGIPLEADGIEVEGLEQALADGHRPKLVHIIPNFHNPAGCTLSEQKRRRLVELSAEHGFWIFEDDPYREVRFGGEPLPTMLALAEGTEAKVVHASSFSKTVSPGVRVGYLVGPAEEIAALAKGAAETYISPNMLAESIVFELCRSGALDDNIAAVNAALAERRDAVVRELGEQIPEAEFVVPRRRLLPLARPRRGHRHPADARPGQGGRRGLRRRPRLHARRRREQPPSLVRQRPARRRPRGHRPDRPGARVDPGVGSRPTRTARRPPTLRTVRRRPTPPATAERLPAERRISHKSCEFLVAHRGRSRACSPRSFTRRFTEK